MVIRGAGTTVDSQEKRGARKGGEKKAGGERGATLNVTKVSEQLMKEPHNTPCCKESSHAYCHKHGPEHGLKISAGTERHDSGTGYANCAPAQTIPMITHQRRQCAGLLHTTKKFFIAQTDKRGHGSKSETQKCCKNGKILSGKLLTYIQRQPVIAIKIQDTKCGNSHRERVPGLKRLADSVGSSGGHGYALSAPNTLLIKVHLHPIPVVD